MTSWSEIMPGCQSRKRKSMPFHPMASSNRKSSVPPRRRSRRGETTPRRYRAESLGELGSRKNSVLESRRSSSARTKPHKQGSVIIPAVMSTKGPKYLHLNSSNSLNEWEAMEIRILDNDKYAVLVPKISHAQSSDHLLLQSSQYSDSQTNKSIAKQNHNISHGPLRKQTVCVEKVHIKNLLHTKREKCGNLSSSRSSEYMPSEATTIPATYTGDTANLSQASSDTSRLRTNASRDDSTDTSEEESTLSKRHYRKTVTEKESITLIRRLEDSSKDRDLEDDKDDDDDDDNDDEIDDEEDEDSEDESDTDDSEEDEADTDEAEEKKGTADDDYKESEARSIGNSYHLKRIQINKVYDKNPLATGETNSSDAKQSVTSRSEDASTGHQYTNISETSKSTVQSRNYDPDLSKLNLYNARSKDIIYTSQPADFCEQIKYRKTYVDDWPVALNESKKPFYSFQLYDETPERTHTSGGETTTNLNEPSTSLSTSDGKKWETLQHGHECYSGMPVHECYSGMPVHECYSGIPGHECYSGMPGHEYLSGSQGTHYCTGTQSISMLSNTLAKNISFVPLPEEEIARYKQIALQILMERKQCALDDNQDMELQPLQPKRVLDVPPRQGGKKKRNTASRKPHKSGRLRSKDGRLQDSLLHSNLRSSQRAGFWTPWRIKSQIEKHRERFNPLDGNQPKITRSRNVYATQTGRGLKKFSKQSQYKDRNTRQGSATLFHDSPGSKSQKLTPQSLKRGQMKRMIQQAPEASKVKQGASVFVRKIMSAPLKVQKLPSKTHNIFPGSSQPTVKKSTGITLSQHQLKPAGKPSVGTMKTTKTGAPLTDYGKYPVNYEKISSAKTVLVSGKAEGMKQTKRAGSVTHGKMYTTFNNGKQNLHSLDSKAINDSDIIKTTSYDDTLPSDKILSKSESIRSYLVNTKSQTEKLSENEQTEKSALSKETVLIKERVSSQKNQVKEDARKDVGTASSTNDDTTTIGGGMKAPTKPRGYLELLQNILKSPTARAAQALGMFLQKPEAQEVSDRDYDITVDQIISSYQKIFDQLYAITEKGNTNTKSSDKDNMAQTLENSLTSIVAKTSHDMPLQMETSRELHNLHGTDAVQKQNKVSSSCKIKSRTSGTPVNGDEAKSLNNGSSSESSASVTTTPAAVRDDTDKPTYKRKENVKSTLQTENNGSKLSKYNSVHSGVRCKSRTAVGIPRIQGRLKKDEESSQVNKHLAGGKKFLNYKSLKEPVDNRKSKSNHDSSEAMKRKDKQQLNHHNQKRNVSEINVANKEPPVQQVENITNQLPLGWSGVCKKAAADVPHNQTTATTIRKTSLSDSSCCTVNSKINSTLKTSLSCTRQLLKRRIQVGTNVEEIPALYYKSAASGNNSSENISEGGNAKCTENDSASSIYISPTSVCYKPVDCMVSMQTNPDNGSHLSKNFLLHKECKSSIQTHALVTSQSEEKIISGDTSKQAVEGQAQAFIKDIDIALGNQVIENEKSALSAQNIKIGTQLQGLQEHTNASTLCCSSEAIGIVRTYPAITIFAPQACLNILTPKSSISPHSSKSGGNETVSEIRASTNGLSQNVQSCLQSTSFSAAANSTTFTDQRIANQTKEPSENNIPRLPTPVIDEKPLRSALKSNSEQWTRVESCHSGIQREVPNNVTTRGQKQVHFKCRSAFKYGFSASSSTVLQLPGQEDQSMSGVPRPYKKASYIVPSSGFSKLNAQTERPHKPGEDKSKPGEDKASMKDFISPPIPHFTRNVQTKKSGEGKHILSDNADHRTPSPQGSLREQTVSLKPQVKYSEEARHLSTKSAHSDISKPEPHKDTPAATKSSLSWSKQHLTKSQDAKDKHFVSSAALKAILVTPFSFPRASNIFRNDAEACSRPLTRQSWRSRSAEGFESKNVTSRIALQCLKNDSRLKKIIAPLEAFPSPYVAKSFHSDMHLRLSLSNSAIVPGKPPNKFVETGANAPVPTKIRGFSENTSCAENAELHNSTNTGFKAREMTDSVSAHFQVLDRNSTPSDYKIEQKVSERKRTTGSHWKPILSEEESEISDGSSLQAVRKHIVASTCRMIIRESRNLMVSNLQKHVREDSPQRPISDELQGDRNDNDIKSHSNDGSQFVTTPICKDAKEVANNSISLSGTQGSDIAQHEDISPKYQRPSSNVENPTSKCAPPSVILTKSDKEGDGFGSACNNELQSVLLEEISHEVANNFSDQRSLPRDNESLSMKRKSHPDIRLCESITAVTSPIETDLEGNTQSQYISKSRPLKAKNMLPAIESIVMPVSQSSSDKSLYSSAVTRSQVFCENNNVHIRTNRTDSDQGSIHIEQRSRDMGHGVRDTYQGSMHIEQRSRDIEQGSRGMGKSSRDIGQGRREMGQDINNLGHGSRDLRQGNYDMEYINNDIEQISIGVIQDSKDKGQGCSNRGQGSRETGQGSRDTDQGSRDTEQGSSVMRQGRREIEHAITGMEQGNKDMRQINNGMVQGIKEMRQCRRDTRQGSRDTRQGSSDIGNGNKDEGQGRRDMGQRSNDMKQGSRCMGQGSRDLRHGNKDVGQGSRDMGQGSRDMEQGSRDVDQSSRDRGQGNRDVGQGSRDVGQGSRDVGQGSRDVGQGSRDVEQVSRDIGQGCRDLGQYNADMRQGGKHTKHEGRDIGLGHISRCADQFMRDLKERGDRYTGQEHKNRRQKSGDIRHENRYTGYKESSIIGKRKIDMPQDHEYAEQNSTRTVQERNDTGQVSNDVGHVSGNTGYENGYNDQELCKDITPREINVMQDNADTQLESQYSEEESISVEQVSEYVYHGNQDDKPGSKYTYYERKDLGLEQESSKDKGRKSRYTEQESNEAEHEILDMRQRIRDTAQRDREIRQKCRCRENINRGAGREEIVQERTDVMQGSRYIQQENIDTYTIIRYTGQDSTNEEQEIKDVERDNRPISQNSKYSVQEHRDTGQRDTDTGINNRDAGKCFDQLGGKEAEPRIIDIQQQASYTELMSRYIDEKIRMWQDHEEAGQSGTYSEEVGRYSRKESIDSGKGIKDGGHHSRDVKLRLENRDKEQGSRYLRQESSDARQDIGRSNRHTWDDCSDSKKEMRYVELDNIKQIYQIKYTEQENRERDHAAIDVMHENIVAGLESEDVKEGKRYIENRNRDLGQISRDKKQRNKDTEMERSIVQEGRAINQYSSHIEQEKGFTENESVYIKHDSKYGGSEGTFLRETSRDSSQESRDIGSESRTVCRESGNIGSGGRIIARESSDRGQGSRYAGHDNRNVEQGKGFILQESRYAGQERREECLDIRDTGKRSRYREQEIRDAQYDSIKTTQGSKYVGHENRDIRQENRYSGQEAKDIEIGSINIRQGSNDIRHESRSIEQESVDVQKGNRFIMLESRERGQVNRYIERESKDVSQGERNARQMSSFIKQGNVFKDTESRDRDILEGDINVRQEIFTEKDSRYVLQGNKYTRPGSRETEQDNREARESNKVISYIEQRQENKRQGSKNVEQGSQDILKEGTDSSHGSINSYDGWTAQNKGMELQDELTHLSKTRHHNFIEKSQPLIKNSETFVGKNILLKEDLQTLTDQQEESGMIIHLAIETPQQDIYETKPDETKETPEEQTEKYGEPLKNKKAGAYAPLHCLLPEEEQSLNVQYQTFEKELMPMDCNISKINETKLLLQNTEDQILKTQNQYFEGKIVSSLHIPPDICNAKPDLTIREDNFPNMAISSTNVIVFPASKHHILEERANTFDTSVSDGETIKSRISGFNNKEDFAWRRTMNEQESKIRNDISAVSGVMNTPLVASWADLLSPDQEQKLSAVDDEGIYQFVSTRDSTCDINILQQPSAITLEQHKSETLGCGRRDDAKIDIEKTIANAAMFYETKTTRIPRDKMIISNSITAPTASTVAMSQTDSAKGEDRAEPGLYVDVSVITEEPMEYLQERKKETAAKSTQAGEHEEISVTSQKVDKCAESSSRNATEKRGPKEDTELLIHLKSPEKDATTFDNFTTDSKAPNDAYDEEDIATTEEPVLNTFPVQTETANSESLGFEMDPNVRLISQTGSHQIKFLHPNLEYDIFKNNSPDEPEKVTGAAPEIILDELLFLPLFCAASARQFVTDVSPQAHSSKDAQRESSIFPEDIFYQCRLYREHLIQQLHPKMPSKIVCDLNAFDLRKAALVSRGSQCSFLEALETEPSGKTEINTLSKAQCHAFPSRTEGLELERNTGKVSQQSNHLRDVETQNSPELYSSQNDTLNERQASKTKTNLSEETLLHILIKTPDEDELVETCQYDKEASDTGVFSCHEDKTESPCSCFKRLVKSHFKVTSANKDTSKSIIPVVQESKKGEDITREGEQQVTESCGLDNESNMYITYPGNDDIAKLGARRKDFEKRRCKQEQHMATKENRAKVRSVEEKILIKYNKQREDNKTVAEEGALENSSSLRHVRAAKKIKFDASGVHQSNNSEHVDERDSNKLTRSSQKRACDICNYSDLQTRSEKMTQQLNTVNTQDRHILTPVYDVNVYQNQELFTISSSAQTRATYLIDFEDKSSRCETRVAHQKKPLKSSKLVQTETAPCVLNARKIYRRHKQCRNKETQKWASFSPKFTYKITLSHETSTQTLLKQSDFDDPMFVKQRSINVKKPQIPMLRDSCIGTSDTAIQFDPIICGKDISLSQSNDMGIQVECDFAHGTNVASRSKPLNGVKAPDSSKTEIDSRRTLSRSSDVKYNHIQQKAMENLELFLKSMRERRHTSYETETSPPWKPCSQPPMNYQDEIFLKDFVIKTPKLTASPCNLKSSMLDTDSLSRCTKVQMDCSESVYLTPTISQQSTDDAQKQGSFNKHTSSYKDLDIISMHVSSSRPMVNWDVHGNSSLYVNSMNKQSCLDSLETNYTMPACSKICPDSDINWKKFHAAPKVVKQEQSALQMPHSIHAMNSTFSLSRCMFQQKESDYTHIPGRSNTITEQVKTTLTMPHSLNIYDKCVGDEVQDCSNPSHLISTAADIKIPVLLYEASRTIVSQSDGKEKSQSAANFTTGCTNPFLPTSTNPFVYSAPILLATSFTLASPPLVVVDQPLQPLSSPFSNNQTNQVNRPETSTEDWFTGQTLISTASWKDIPAAGVNFAKETLHDKPCLSAKEEFASFFGTQPQEKIKNVRLNPQLTTGKSHGSDYISEDEDLIIFSDTIQDTNEKQKQEIQFLTSDSQKSSRSKSAISKKDVENPEASMLASHDKNWFDALIQDKNDTDPSITKKGAELTGDPKIANKRKLQSRHFLERTSPNRSENGRHHNSKSHEKITRISEDIHRNDKAKHMNFEIIDSENKTSSDSLNNLASRDFTSRCLLLKKNHGVQIDDSFAECNSSEETIDKDTMDSSNSFRSLESHGLSTQKSPKSPLSVSHCQHRIDDEEANLNILETVTTLTSKFIDIFNGLKDSMSNSTRKRLSKLKMPSLERNKQYRVSSKSGQLHRTHRYSSKKSHLSNQSKKETCLKDKHYCKNPSQKYEQDICNLYTCSGKKKAAIFKKTLFVESASTTTSSQSEDHLTTSEMSDKRSPLYGHGKQREDIDKFSRSPQLYTEYTRLPLCSSNSESPKATADSSLSSNKSPSESHQCVKNPPAVTCGISSVSTKEHVFIPTASCESYQDCQKELLESPEDWSLDDLAGYPDHFPSIFIPHYSQFYVSVNNGGYPTPNLPFFSTVFTFVDDSYEPFMPDQQNSTPKLVLVDDQEDDTQKKRDVLTSAADDIQETLKQDTALSNTDKRASEVQEEITLQNIATKCSKGLTKDTALQEMIQKAMSAPGLSISNDIRFEKVQPPSGNIAKYVDVVPLLAKSEVIFENKFYEQDYVSGFQEVMRLARDLDVSFRDKILYDPDRKKYINELGKDLNETVCNYKSTNHSDISSSCMGGDVGRFSASGFPSLHGQYYIKDDFTSPPKRKKCEYSNRSTYPADASISKDTRVIGHQCNRRYEPLQFRKEGDMAKCYPTGIPFPSMTFENRSKSYRKNNNTYYYEEGTNRPIKFVKKLKESPLKEAGASITYSYRGCEEYFSHILVDSSPLSDILTEFSEKRESSTEIEARHKIKEDRQCQYEDCEPDTYDELGSLCSEMQDTTSKLYPAEVDSGDNKGYSVSDVLSSVSLGQTFETLLCREFTGSQNSTSNAATQTIHQVKRCTSCSHYFSAIEECSDKELAKHDIRNDDLMHEQGVDLLGDVQRQNLSTAFWNIDFMVPRSAPIMRSCFTQTDVDAPRKIHRLHTAKIDKPTLTQIRELMGRCIKSKNFKYYVQHIVDERVRNTLQQTAGPGIADKDNEVDKGDFVPLLKKTKKGHEGYSNAIKNVGKILKQTSVPSFNCQATIQGHENLNTALTSKESEKPSPNVSISIKLSSKTSRNKDSKRDLSWPHKSDNGKSLRGHQYFKRSFEKINIDTVHGKSQKKDILQNPEKPSNTHSKEVSDGKGIDHQLYKSLQRPQSAVTAPDALKSPSADSVKLWCTTETLERTVTLASFLSPLDKVTNEISEHSFDFSPSRRYTQTYLDHQTTTLTNISSREKLATEKSANHGPPSSSPHLRTPRCREHLLADSVYLSETPDNMEISHKQRLGSREETIKTNNTTHNRINFEQQTSTPNTEVRAMSSQHDPVWDFHVLGGEDSLPANTTTMSTESPYPVQFDLGAQEQSDVSSSSSTKIDYGRLKHILSAESKLLWKNLTRLEKSYDRCKRCRKQYDSILGTSKISGDCEAKTDKLETRCELHSDDDGTITQCSIQGTEIIDDCIKEKKHTIKSNEIAAMLTPKVNFDWPPETSRGNQDRSVKCQVLHELGVCESPSKIACNISGMGKVGDFCSSHTKDSLSKTSDQHVLAKIAKDDGCKKPWDVKGKNTARMIQIFERGNGFFQDTVTDDKTKCEGSGVQNFTFFDDKEDVKRNNRRTSIRHHISLPDHKPNEQCTYGSHQKVHSNVKRREHKLSDQFSQIGDRKQRKSTPLDDENTFGFKRTGQSNDQTKKSKIMYDTPSSIKCCPTVKPSPEKHEGINQNTFPSTTSIADVQHILAMNAPNSETDEWIQKLVNILHEMQQAFPHISATHTHSTFKRDRTIQPTCPTKAPEISSGFRLSDTSEKLAGLHEISRLDQESHKPTDVNIVRAYNLTDTTDPDKCHDVCITCACSKHHRSDNSSCLPKTITHPDKMVNDVQVADNKSYHSVKSARSIRDIILENDTKAAGQSDKVTPYSWLLESSDPTITLRPAAANDLEMGNPNNCIDENNQASDNHFLVQQTNARVCMITLKDGDKNLYSPPQHVYTGKTQDAIKISRNKGSVHSKKTIPDEITRFSTHETHNSNRISPTIDTVFQTTAPFLIPTIKSNSFSGTKTHTLEHIYKPGKRGEIRSLSCEARRTPVRQLDKSKSMVNFSHFLFMKDSDQTFGILDYLSPILTTTLSTNNVAKEEERYLGNISLINQAYNETEQDMETYIEQEVPLSLISTAQQAEEIPNEVSVQNNSQEGTFKSAASLQSKTNISNLCLEQCSTRSCKDMVVECCWADGLLYHEGDRLPAAPSHRNVEEQVDQTYNGLGWPLHTALEQVDKLQGVTSTFKENKHHAHLKPIYKLQKPDVSISDEQQPITDIIEFSENHIWKHENKQFSTASDDYQQLEESYEMVVCTMNNMIDTGFMSNYEGCLIPNDTLTIICDNTTSGSTDESCQLKNNRNIGDNTSSLANTSSLLEQKVPRKRSYESVIDLSPRGKDKSLVENSSPDEKIHYMKKQDRKCYGQDCCTSGAPEIVHGDISKLTLHDKIMDRESVSPASLSPKEYVSRDSTTPNKESSQSSGNIINLSDTTFKSGNLESAHQQTIQMQSFEIPIDIYTVPVHRCSSPQRKKKKKADMPTRTVVISGPVRNMSIAVQRHMRSCQEDSNLGGNASTELSCPDAVEGPHSSNRVPDQVTLGGDDRKLTQNWRHAVKRMLPFGKRATSGEKEKKMPTQLLT